jgi:hypothetical protein
MRCKFVPNFQITVLHIIKLNPNYLHNKSSYANVHMLIDENISPYTVYFTWMIHTLPYFVCSVIVRYKSKFSYQAASLLLSSVARSQRYVSRQKPKYHSH